MDDVVHEIQEFASEVFRDVGDDHVRALAEDRAEAIRRRFSETSRLLRRIHARLILLREEEAAKHLAVTAAMMSALLTTVQRKNSGLTGKAVNEAALEIARRASLVHRALAPSYLSPR